MTTVNILAARFYNTNQPDSYPISVFITELLLAVGLARSEMTERRTRCSYRLNCMYRIFGPWNRASARAGLVSLIFVTVISMDTRSERTLSLNCRTLRCSWVSNWKSRVCARNMRG